MKSGTHILDYLKANVLVADGAMGTMIQNADLELSDFFNLEGCNEILNLSRPEIIEEIHLEYFNAGSDAVETNTFGCNFANLFEYGIREKVFELSLMGAKIARRAADQFGGNRFVLGSIGPGTKLPTLGHADFTTLKDAYKENAHGLIEGGSDAILIETSQDLLQAKSAIIGTQEAIDQFGIAVPIFVSITIEQNGTMLLGSDVASATTSLINLGIDSIGLNCATGPEEMSEHLRYLSNNAPILISCMPNAGLPILRDDKAVYPLDAQSFAQFFSRFARDYQLSIVGGCCGTTPSHIAEVKKIIPETKNLKEIELQDSVSSLYQAINLNQDTTYLTIGERANANGSKRFRSAMLAEDWDECVSIAVEQVKSGAHVIDLCVDYVGRNGVDDMNQLASRLATASTLPVMLDSTEPEVIEAGLQHLGGRCLVNSVNFEDGQGKDSRYWRNLNLAKKYGAAVVALTIDENGQARTAGLKVEIAERLISGISSMGIPESSILVDCLTFPIATGQEETRRDGVETLNAIQEIKRRHPEVKTILGLSNISFGLNAAARQALNSVFLSEAMKYGLDAAIVDAGKIIPLNKIPDDILNHLRNLIHDKREFDKNGICIYDPLKEILNAYSESTLINSSVDTLDSIRSLGIDENLKRRIVDGISKEIEKDLDHAMEAHTPIEIINNFLLPAMKEVGDLFGAGIMQLPFVLQSAEVMKVSVSYLEKYMEKADSSGKGKVLLATVKGDVHDIGKNLVDIILSNNGYTVVNIGIKQTIQQIIDAAIENNVDIIGMSGLLVKSTVIMKENLEELNSRNLSKRFPVILGGAALTRSYVEDDLANTYDGTVRYAKDAFEGLSLVEGILRERSGEQGILPPLKKRIHKQNSNFGEIENTQRSSIAEDNVIPVMPFYGNRIIKGIPLNEISRWIDERALFVGQWGLKPSRSSDESLEDIFEREGRPRLRYWLEQIQTNNLNEFAVVYGYFPAYSFENSIYILNESRADILAQFDFPRQRLGEKLCLADFVKSKNSGEDDHVAFHIVTMGNAISKYTNELFNQGRFRDYLEVHGLSVQLTEALAEMWHARIRQEMNIHLQDSASLKDILKQSYQGERFSFGYPACPDLEMQVPLMKLLNPERIGVELSEENQLHPEQSTSAIIFHHPEARYFNAR